MASIIFEERFEVVYPFMPLGSKGVSYEIISKFDSISHRLSFSSLVGNRKASEGADGIFIFKMSPRCSLCRTEIHYSLFVIKIKIFFFFPRVGAH